MPGLHERKPGFFHGCLQPIGALPLDGEKRSAGSGQVSGFHGFRGDHAGKRRGDPRIVAHDAGAADFLLYLRPFGIELGALRPGHLVGGLGRFETRRGFIELLIRNRLFGRQFFHALERALGQIQVGFGAGHTAVRFRDSAHHFGFAGLGAENIGVQILGIQRYQELALPHPVANLHGHLAHVCHHLAREHRGRARANRSGGLIHIRPLLAAYRCRLDRNGRRARNRFRVRLAAAAAP